MGEPYPKKCALTLVWSVAGNWTQTFGNFGSWVPSNVLVAGCLPGNISEAGVYHPIQHHAETTTAVSPKRSSDASSMLNIVKPHLFVTNSSILQPEISDFFRHDGHPDQSHQSPSLGTPFGCGTSSRWRWTCWTATETWRAMKIWKKVVKKA